MTDTLVKLRDYAEKRLALAAQRLHIILLEAKGWAKLQVVSCGPVHVLTVRRPQTYGVYQFDEAQIDYCLSLVNKAIVLCAWLAATARDQLWRFKEFKLWLQYGEASGVCMMMLLLTRAESHRLHTDDVKIRPLSWDILEVNRYLVDGLNGCELDRWFEGDRVPSVTPDEIRAPPMRKTLAQAMKETREAIDKPRPPPWEAPKPPGDISGLDRNVDQLVQEIARVGQRVFGHAGSGLGDTVTVHGRWTAPSGKGKERAAERPRMRERTTVEEGLATQYVLMSVPRMDERVGRRE